MYRIGFIAIISSIGIAFSGGCRENGGENANNNLNNNNNNAGTGHSVYQVQDPEHPQHLQQGDQVVLEGVVVTAVDTYGSRTGNIWVQEPDAGPFSGVLVFRPTVIGGTTADLNLGDLVTVRGEIDEFALDTDTSGRTVTEIINGSVEVLGAGTVPEPEEVVAQDIMSDTSAEAWEGVLVRLRNLRATDKSEAYGEVTFMGGLVADDDLFDVYSHVEVGTCYGEITGVVNYFFKYFLLPRSAADLTVAPSDEQCDATGLEICDDGIDNDGDGWIDCDDWDCADDPACKETECDDGVDNDGDGLTDCADPDCWGTAACPAQVENSDALCDDGVDNDGDGLVDCEDPSCANHPDVTVCLETICDDEIDNDGDGYTDCDDPDCALDPACYEAICDDEVDNDGDGYTDCADRDCWTNPICWVDPPNEIGEAQCTDGVDNDGDGHTDCQDFSCQDSYPGCTETICDDGIDNDGDGFIDCQDWDCQRLPGACPDYETDVLTCSDGLDNDGDGFIDCDDFSCRCCADNGCSGSFKYSVATCPPCTN